MIILLIIGAAVVVGIGLFIKYRGSSGEKVKAGERPSLGAWYEQNQKLIKDNKPQDALTEIEKKVAQSQNSDPGLKYPLFELQGDALLALKRCGDAASSYQKSLSALNDATFKWVPQRSETPMTPDEKNAAKAEIQKKMNSATACAQ